MKRAFCAVLALLWALWGAWALAEEENLLKNGDFSLSDGELPENWRKEMWLTDQGVSLLSMASNGITATAPPR